MHVVYHSNFNSCRKNSRSVESLEWWTLIREREGLWVSFGSLTSTTVFFFLLCSCLPLGNNSFLFFASSFSSFVGFFSPSPSETTSRTAFFSGFQLQEEFHHGWLHYLILFSHFWDWFFLFLYFLFSPSSHGKRLSLVITCTLFFNSLSVFVQAVFFSRLRYKEEESLSFFCVH